MTVLALNDLSISKELDNKALASVSGRGNHYFFGGPAPISSGSWGGWSRSVGSFKGIGVLHHRLHKVYKAYRVRYRIQKQTQRGTYWKQWF